MDIYRFDTEAAAVTFLAAIDLEAGLPNQDAQTMSVIAKHPTLDKWRINYMDEIETYRDTKPAIFVDSTLEAYTDDWYVGPTYP